MKTRMAMIGATLATLFAGSALAAAHTDGAWMTVDGDAPVRAILLQTVSIDATAQTSEKNPPTMRVADTVPVEVTLLPTVHVTARSEALATTLLPTVRVTARAHDAQAADEIAEVERPVMDNARIDDESAIEMPIGLQRRTMPR